MLAEPLRSFITGGWTTVIAHRLTAADGTFLGVMSRRIDPGSYEKFFASVALGPSAAIALFHADGTMLARYPHIDELIGKKFKSAPLMKSVAGQGGLQTLRVKSPVDGQDRLGAAAPLTHFPFVVVATNTVEAALSDWREQTRFMVSAATLSAVVIAFILFLIVRTIMRQNRDVQQRLDAEKERLDTALNNMTQGLVLYDASARIVTCQPALHRHVQPVDRRRQAGLHYLRPDPAPQGHRIVRRRRPTASAIRSCATSSQGKITTAPSCETGDGRFQVVNKPLAQGGWVATIEDITDRRKLEQERDRNHAFLREIIDHIPSQITVKDASDRRYVLVNRCRRRAIRRTRAKTLSARRRSKCSRGDRRADQRRRRRARCNPARRLFMDEHAWESRSMGTLYVTSKRLAIRDAAGEPRYLINVVEDVTERRRADEKIAHMAHYDALTDLPNRVLFREQIERELKKVSRRRAVRAALYRHRRVQGHQRLARPPCRRRAVEGGRRPHPRLHQADRPDRAARRRRVRGDPDCGRARSADV